jgi:hypothetical protein
VLRKLNVAQQKARSGGAQRGTQWGVEERHLIWLRTFGPPLRAWPGGRLGTQWEAVAQQISSFHCKLAKPTISRQRIINDLMNFAQLFKKSNSSLNQLQGNVLQCSVSEVRGDLVVVETGLARSSVCFQSELNSMSNITAARSSNVRFFERAQRAGTDVCRRFARQEGCVIGIEEVESAYGEPHLVFPKMLQKICRRKLVWTELTKVWRSAQNNRIKGFILNSVKGGYAVAIAGHIAFLPRSLCLDKKVFHSQWRKFSILNMNPKIGNIVVKEYSPKAANALRFNFLRTFGPKKTGSKNRLMPSMNQGSIETSVALFDRNERRSFRRKEAR